MVDSRVEEVLCYMTFEGIMGKSGDIRLRDTGRGLGSGGAGWVAIRFNRVRNTCLRMLVFILEVMGVIGLSRGGIL